MSWRAVFLDGPLAGPNHDRTFAAADPCDRLWLARVPEDDGRVGPDTWSVVGSVPGTGRPADWWPGQVEYARDTVLSDAACAVFRFVG